MVFQFQILWGEGVYAPVGVSAVLVALFPSSICQLGPKYRGCDGGGVYLLRAQGFVAQLLCFQINILEAIAQISKSPSINVSLSRISLVEANIYIVCEWLMECVIKIVHNFVKIIEGIDLYR